MGRSPGQRTPSEDQRRLSAEQRERWERDGFLRLERFAARETLDAMHAKVVEMAESAVAGSDIGSAYVVQEKSLAREARSAEDALSKLFRVHRDVPVFHEFCCRPQLLDCIADLIGPDLDCFLSQFIFKNPGALGQPWHQDAFYFPFDRRPQVGVWLAVSEAREDNGPLWVLPGSHREAVHDVVADRREHANYAYVEIVDHDMSGAVPVLMQPGDLLLFHSNLMHRSTDNVSSDQRAAMVYHYGETGTVDHSREKWGMVPPNVDWMPVRGRGLDAA